jgi:hypothetical protein
VNLAYRHLPYLVIGSVVRCNTEKDAAIHASKASHDFRYLSTGYFDAAVSADATATKSRKCRKKCGGIPENRVSVFAEIRSSVFPTTYNSGSIEVQKCRNTETRLPRHSLHR